MHCLISSPFYRTSLVLLHRTTPQRLHICRIKEELIVTNYLLAREILLLCDHLRLPLVRHVPGKLKCFSRKRKLAPVNTEWELFRSVFQATTIQWGSPHVDLFATSLNYKLQVFVSPVPDPKAYAVDAMSFPLGRNVCLRFPSIQVPVCSSSEDFSRTVSDHSYCSSLAQTSLVSRSSPVLRSPTGFTSKTQSSFPIQGQDSSSQPREATSVRVASQG